MKRCPKCGTILDDSKNKCYMCGSDLENKTLGSFVDNFDQQIGAVITNNQDNVFNNGKDIVNETHEILDLGEGNDSSFFSYSSSSKGAYGEEIEQLDGEEYETLEPLPQDIKKVNKSNKPNKVSAQPMTMTPPPFNPMMNNQMGNMPMNGVMNQSPMGMGQPSTGMNPSLMGMGQPSMGNMPMNGMPTGGGQMQPPMMPNRVQGYYDNSSNMDMMNSKNNMSNINFDSNSNNKKDSFYTVSANPKKKEKSSSFLDKKLVSDDFDEERDNPYNDVKSKKAINWGNNLSGKEKNDVKIKTKDSKISSGGGGVLAFNFFCILIFIGLVVGGYFIFVRGKHNEFVNFGGLTYTISDDFTLESSDDLLQKYSYGDSCALSISYGPNSSGKDGLETYFDMVKKEYSSNENVTFKNEQMNINDNTWSSLDVVYFVEDPTANSKLREITKYRYISIIYNANIYHIIYFNPMNDATCSSMFGNFLDSLEF